MDQKIGFGKSNGQYSKLNNFSCIYLDPKYTFPVSLVGICSLAEIIEDKVSKKLNL